MASGSGTEVHIVFIEDVPAEAARVEAALRRDGLAFRLQRVETKGDFLGALDLAPDVILSDHGLPAFDGLAALAVAREKCPRVPFFFVTSALTREMEIEKLASGVADYIPKSQLDGLAPAIRLALDAVKTPPAAASKAAELEAIKAKLLALMEEYERAGGYLPICSSCKKIRDEQGEWLAPERFFNKYAGLKFTHGLCPDCLRKFSTF